MILFNSAMENWRADMGCFDELSFYGNPASGSTTDLPFASCHFNPIFFSSSQVQQQLNSGSWTSWTDHMNLPVRCAFSVHANSIIRMNVKLCGSGSRDPLIIRLTNDDGDECQSRGLSIGHSRQGRFLTFSSGNLGSCQNFRVTQTTRALLSNNGNDDLCITDLYLDTASQDGTTRVLRCRYDADTHLQYRYVHIVLRTNKEILISNFFSIRHGEFRALHLLCY